MLLISKKIIENKFYEIGDSRSFDSSLLTPTINKRKFKYTDRNANERAILGLLAKHDSPTYRSITDNFEISMSYLTIPGLIELRNYLESERAIVHRSDLRRLNRQAEVAKRNSVEKSQQFNELKGQILKILQPTLDKLLNEPTRSNLLKAIDVIKLQRMIKELKIDNMA
jgi:hypothetical protein